MSLLNSVVKGKVPSPDLIVLYGVDGVGKSTFASQAPAPIFVGPEKGTANLDVARFPSIKSHQDVLNAIAALIVDPHQYQTLAIDSLDWLEPLVWDKVCIEAGAPNIEAAYGGYGKGYVAANKIWMDLMARLTDLREKRKMNIVLIAHAQVKPFNDPQQNATYDRYQLKLNDKASALFREFVDCVFFANFEVYTKQDGKQRTRAHGEGSRLIYADRRPGYDAKNRLGLPPVLPLDWNAYIQAKQSGTPEKPEVVIANIKEMMGQLDAETRAKVEPTLAAAEGNTPKLLAIQNRLRTLLSQ